MSEGKDIFNDSLRERLENLEVPYNENHWAEMEEMLDKVPAGPAQVGKSNWKYFTAAGIAAAVIAGYFLVNRQGEEAIPMPENDNQEILVESPGTPPVIKKENTQEEVNQNINTDELEAGDHVTAEQHPIKSGADEKAERYAGMSEEQLKDEAKTTVNEEVRKDTRNMGETPKLDNTELKAKIKLVDGGPLCVGSPITFTVEPLRDDVTYFWDFGDKGLKSRKSKAEHTFKRDGNFEVILIISKKGEEKNTYQTSEFVNIEKLPELNMNWDNSQITLEDPYLEIQAKSNVPCSFNWVFNDQQNASGSEVFFLIPEKGNYLIALEGTSRNGCKNTLTEYYAAEKGIKLYVENSFAPDNGMGVEEFMPKEIRDNDLEFTLVVRDRDGNKVFEGHDKYVGWNGRMNNMGNPLPAGTYNWTLHFKDGRGTVHKQLGELNLLR